jgi:uncharacterized protein (DUF2141 family)
MCAKFIITYIVLFLLLSSFDTIQSKPKGKIRIVIKEFISKKGIVRIGLFDSTNQFDVTLTESAFMHTSKAVKGDEMIIDFEHVPAGNYALVLYQDANSNGKFDYLIEDYAISKGKTIIFKTPSFNRSKFYYYGNDTLIRLYCDNERVNVSAQTGSWTIAPIISFSPETKLEGGISTYRLFKFIPDTVTRTSFFDFFVMITQNKQYTIHNNYLIFTPNEKYLITGLNWFQYFPQYYFGVGNDLKENDKEEVKYSQFIFDFLVQRKILPSLFAGAGYRYATIFQQQNVAGGLLETTKYTGYQGSKIAGYQFAITSDNRDNVYYAAKGHYLRLHAVFHSKLTQSQFNYQVYDIDYRKFFRVFKERWDVLAFQSYGYFTYGDVPWNELGAMGDSDIMRGYYSGRFRDKKYLATQVEYRLVFNKLVGMVFFAAVGEVGDDFNNFTLGGLKPSGGTGLRLKVNRKDRLNFRIDGGLGLDGFNFYVGGSEAF